MHVGIVGAGRFGRALATRLPGSLELLVSDQVADKATELARSVSGRACRAEDVFRESDVILLAVPDREVLELSRTHAGVIKPGAILVNLATGLPTPEVQAVIGRPDINVLGVKPVTQAHALQNGGRVVFIVSPWEGAAVGTLTELLREIGPCVSGDEMIVQRINAIATRAGLRLIHDLGEELRTLGVSEPIVEAAIQSVAVGTIQDYPPREPNYYIEQRLREVLETIEKETSHVELKSGYIDTVCP